jgi:phosphoribosyl 1,2-cyclic phosphodiesterase
MAVKFCSLSSGSSGNCQYIETKSTRLIIDAGFSGKRIEQLLKEIEVDPRTLDGILVTHEHIDHSKGVGILSRRYGIPVFANEKTWIGMEPIVKQVKTENTRVFISNNVNHDALEPVGYILFNGDKKLSFLTDTGCVNDSMKAKIRNSHLFFMESNHDIRMLKEGSYPWPLKQRILSPYGHLSNDDAASVLGDVLKGEREVVLLAHLSQDNNIPKLAFDTVRTSLKSQGFDVDNDIRLSLTKRDGISEFYIID